MERTIYNELRALLKKEDIDKKRTGNGIALDYISWATAWDVVSQNYKIVRKVYERDDGCIYWTDGKTAWVKVSVTIEDEPEQIEYLPIMGFKNDALGVDKITAMEVNKAIQRCTVKAIARACGYGIQVYIGEDLPDERDGARVDASRQNPRVNESERVSKNETMSQAQLASIIKLMGEAAVSKEEMQATFGSLKGKSKAEADSVIEWLEAKKAEKF